MLCAGFQLIDFVLLLLHHGVQRANGFYIHGIVGAVGSLQVTLCIFTHQLGEYLLNVLGGKAVLNAFGPHGAGGSVVPEVGNAFQL